MEDFWLDFETFSAVNLKQVGAHKYAEHSSTEIILTSWAEHTGNANVSEKFPSFIEERLNDPNVLIWAFNAPFERAILRGKLGFDLPVERFRCVMAWAYHLGFAGSLDMVCQQAKLPEHASKMKGGNALIKKFCMPRKATKGKPWTRWTEETAPDDWVRFRDYGKQDAEAERALAMRFQAHPVPAQEQQLWVVDQHINDTGWPIDKTFVSAANKIYAEELRSLRKQLKDITGLPNPNSVPQMQAWLEKQGYKMTNLQAETIRDTLPAIPEGTPAHQALTLRQQIARTTPKKYAALDVATCDGDRLKGTMQMNGASRTSRWAGRIFQPHNLTRPGVKDVDLLARLIQVANREELDFLYSSVMDALSWGIRSAIAAPEGKMLVVSDYSQVESRLLGWFSGCRRLNEVFANDGDPYVDFATVLFNRSDISKEQRDWTKPPSLGCGYQLGDVGLVTYAAGMGVIMDRVQAKAAVDIWRQTYHEVPKMWRWLNDAAMYVITTGQEQCGYGVRIHRDAEYLMIDLPSGRTLFYFDPSIEQNHFGNPAPSYYGLNQYTRKWERQTTFGGKLTENICQAAGRDLLANALYVLVRRGVEVVGHVHDEVVTLVDEHTAENYLYNINAVMSQTPSWAPGLIMKAEGYISQRYRK